MNWQHFQAFMWLRWRLLINQMRRGGTTNVVIQAILLGIVAMAALVATMSFFLIGLLALKDAEPWVLLYVWDGLVIAFLFSWATGLLIELQRSEVLSLEKFLHLPVSLNSAFLINYFSSLFSVTLGLFFPSMIAFSLALALSHGPALLLVLPLLVAFVFMVTALTYQFQGWLAALMVNKRRRRTIIVVVTMLFILICQLPNLVNLLRPWEHAHQKAPAPPTVVEMPPVQETPEGGKAEKPHERERPIDINNENAAREEEEKQSLEQIHRIARLVNTAVPPGWLPLGAEAAAEGNVLPALLGMFGFTLIGAVSLWRSYRTTVRLYTGQFSSGKRVPLVVVSAPAKSVTPAGNLLEKQIPWVSAPAAVIALGSFRSLLRAPEAKMLLLTPAILVVVFGSMLLTKSTRPPDELVPLMAFGAMSMTMLTLVQVVGNQFGFDRAGFRVYVLSAVPRREILLGKNLSVAPLALGMSMLLVVALRILAPMRVEHLLALLPQFVSMYLLFCFMANWMSIFSPMAIRSGSFKPANPKGLAMLFQVMITFLFPFVLAPALLPLGIEYALEAFAGFHDVPFCLIFALVECAIVIFAYRLALTWQGSVLQAREQKILEVVTLRVE